MIDVATPTHTVLSHDPVTWLTTLSAIGIGWVGAYYKSIKPARKLHKEHEAQREMERKAEQYRMEARWNIIDGMSGVEGMYPPVPPLAPRLREMEARLDALEDD
jgi:hypothetical protein